MKVEIGRKYNLLTPIKFFGTDERNNKLYWCKCDCGNEKIVKTTDLVRGVVKSCGCLAKQALIERCVTHGKTKHPLYSKWHTMKSRCNNPNNASYERYGGRGITVCDEWENSFEAFYEWSMANGYKKGLSIDRIDNDGNYEPANCRWATAKEQCNNTSRNRHLEAFGENHTIAEWSRITGINVETLYCRIQIQGLEGEDVLQPLQRKRKVKK